MLEKEILDKRNNIEHLVEEKKKIEESIIDFQGWVGLIPFLLLLPSHLRLQTLILWTIFPSDFSAFPGLYGLFF